jgi:chromosomal replication initiator protein
MFATPGSARAPPKSIPPPLGSPRDGIRTSVSDPDLPPAWRRIRHELRQAVADPVWSIWLEPLSARSLEAGCIELEAPEHLRAWVSGRFGRLLQTCAQRVLGPDAQVAIVGAGESEAPPPAAPRAREDPLNPRLTFEQFVIGDSNRFAHGAALAVAEMPGLAYNPLFICGPPGLGKTHLLHSIGNYVSEHGGGLTVRYTTVEAFTDRFVGALHAKALEGFKAAYRGVDVLLVDDVQFLERKTHTEQEFFHTFNALHQAGAQLVLTSDRLPRDMDALEERLRERFECGLVVDVRPPDLDTRLTILRKRVLQDELRGVAPEALELIARRVASNIRALEGALIRVVAFGSLTGRAVTGELAGEVPAGL